MALSRSEFLDFFCSFNYKRAKNTNVFNQKLFKKIASFLNKYDYDSYLFWSEIFNQYSGDCIKNTCFQVMKSVVLL